MVEQTFIDVADLFDVERAERKPPRFRRATARDAHAERAVAVYAGSARGLARQNLDVVAQTFELGGATIFDLLAEQRRYLEVERAYTNALREAWEARAALKRSLGEVR